MLIHYFSESLRILEQLNGLFAGQLLLRLLEQVSDDVSNVFSVIPDFCILGGLNPDERRIVNSRDLPENLRFSRARFARDQNVGRSHGLSELLVFDLSHSVLVSDG